jgi:hypothetical protein|tara:strand:- start:49 stop:375 length:327 start_codon:yes stop_codon:yes gene_type:complete
MKYKQEYLKLKEQLAAETKEKQKYEGWWHQETDEVSVQKEKVSELEEKLRDLETSKLKVEIDLLRKVVSLHERGTQKTIIESFNPPPGVSGQFATPNGATTSSTTTII